jgi:hypothetical protein
MLRDVILLAVGALGVGALGGGVVVYIYRVKIVKDVQKVAGAATQAADAVKKA